MKIRTGFVSNSSSSSFIVAMTNEGLDDVKNALTEKEWEAIESIVESKGNISMLHIANGECAYDDFVYGKNLESLESTYGELSEVEIEEAISDADYGWNNWHKKTLVNAGKSEKEIQKAYEREVERSKIQRYYEKFNELASSAESKIIRLDSPNVIVESFDY